MKAKWLVSGLVISSLLFNVSVPQEKVSAISTVSAISSYKMVKGKTIQFSVPKNVNVELKKGEVFLKKNGEVIGGIKFMSYNPKKQTLPSLLPKYGTVISSVKVKGLVFPCVRYLIQTEDNRQIHSLLIDSKHNRVFDFWVDQVKMTDQEIKVVCQSIKLTSNQTSVNKVVKGKTIQFSVPAKIHVELYKQEVFFKKNGKVIGGIAFLAYHPKQSLTSLLPNHTTVLHSEKIKGLAFPCVHFLLQTHKNRQSHSLLLDAKHSRAFDLWIDTTKLTEKEIKMIRQSLKLTK